jgi:tetratricopeptide (TPR) repeat protein
VSGREAAVGVSDGGGGRASQTAAASAGEDYAALCQEARAGLAAGNGAGAAAAARRALELLPRGLDAQRLLGLALLAAGETRPALAAFQAALAGDPLDLVAQAGVAQAQEEIGGAASAEAEWLRAWELRPGQPQMEGRLQQARVAAGAPPAPDGAEPYPLTQAALARVYLRGGLFEHAVAEARAALGRQPERADLRLTLAEAFWRSGDVTSAAAVAEELLERLPDCAAANLLLATHWQVVGRDPAPLLSRVRAVDPAGRVAVRLFGHRDGPHPLDGEEGAVRPDTAPAPAAITPDTAVPAATAATAAVPPPAEGAPPRGGEPVLQETVSLPPVLARVAPPAAAAATAAATAVASKAAGRTEPPERGAGVTGQVNAQPDGAGTESEPEPVGPAEAVSPLLSRAPERPRVTPEAPPPAPPLPAAEAPPEEPAPPAAEAPPEEPAPPAAEAPPAPTPEPEPAPAAEIAAPGPPAPPAPVPVGAAGGAFLQSVTHLQGASDLEAAGAAALQAGDYVEAIRQYGAALRRLRTGGDSVPEAGDAARGEAS